jgi:MFS family permease
METAQQSGAPLSLEELSQPARASRHGATYMLLILLGMNTLCYLDRQVINIVAEQIKIELHLQDWQLGALTGLSFAIFYTLFSLPIARVAERMHRPTILAGALGVWSIFTLLCGFAGNFLQLALARMGVGLGEAGGTPAAHALITDRVPRERRAFAMSIFSAGIPLGALSGMMLGGLVADSYGWRAAFLVAAVPGLLLAVAMLLTIPDPGRERTLGGLRESLRRPHEAPRFRDALRVVFRKRAFLLIALGAATGGFVNYVHGAFFAVFFIRAHNDALLQVASSVGAALGIKLGVIGLLGTVMGLMAGVMGLAGTIVGGIVTDRFARHSMNAYMLVPGLSKLAAVPLAVTVLLVNDVVVALAVLGCMNFMRSLSYAPGFSSVQGLVPPTHRATASAMLFFIINIVGMGMGPLGVGILSDIISGAGFGQRDGLRFAMLAAEGVGLLGALLYFRACRYYAREVEG